MPSHRAALPASFGAVRATNDRQRQVGVGDAVLVSLGLRHAFPARAHLVARAARMVSPQLGFPAVLLAGLDFDVAHRIVAEVVLPGHAELTAPVPAQMQLAAIGPDQYVLEYLALIAIGASHEEAVAQIAQSNEVDVSQVEVECVSHWAA